VHAVLVEKILRVEPGVKKLYLLVRAPDDAAAHQRVVHEVALFEVRTHSNFQMCLVLKFIIILFAHHDLCVIFEF
jgi:hypothetical protein